MDHLYSVHGSLGDQWPPGPETSEWDYSLKELSAERRNSLQCGKSAPSPLLLQSYILQLLIFI